MEIKNLKSLAEMENLTSSLCSSRVSTPKTSKDHLDRTPESLKIKIFHLGKEYSLHFAIPMGFCRVLIFENYLIKIITNFHKPGIECSNWQ